MKKIKKIIFDLDNTLINAENNYGKDPADYLFELLEGAMDILSWLIQSGVEIYLATSESGKLKCVSESIQMRKVRESGLEAFFNGNIYVSEIGYKSGTISKLIYERNLSPEDTIYVGDKPLDIIDAHLAGIDAVRIRYGNHINDIINLDIKVHADSEISISPGYVIPLFSANSLDELKFRLNYEGYI